MHDSSTDSPQDSPATQASQEKTALPSGVRSGLEQAVGRPNARSPRSPAKLKLELTSDVRGSYVGSSAKMLRRLSTSSQVDWGDDSPEDSGSEGLAAGEEGGEGDGGGVEDTAGSETDSTNTGDNVDWDDEDEEEDSSGEGEQSPMVSTIWDSRPPPPKPQVSSSARTLATTPHAGMAASRSNTPGRLERRKCLHINVEDEDGDCYDTRGGGGRRMGPNGMILSQGYGGYYGSLSINSASLSQQEKPAPTAGYGSCTSTSSRESNASSGNSSARSSSRLAAEHRELSQPFLSPLSQEARSGSVGEGTERSGPFADGAGGRTAQEALEGVGGGGEEGGLGEGQTCTQAGQDVNSAAVLVGMDGSGGEGMAPAERFERGVPGWAPGGDAAPGQCVQYPPPLPHHEGDFVFRPSATLKAARAAQEDEDLGEAGVRAGAGEGEEEGVVFYRSAGENFDLGGFTIGRGGLVSSPRNSLRRRPSLNQGNNFLVLARLGSGNSGAVHKALHVPSMRLVALKALPLYDAGRRAQVMRELKILYSNLASIDAKRTTRVEPSIEDMEEDGEEGGEEGGREGKVAEEGVGEVNADPGALMVRGDSLRGEEDKEQCAAGPEREEGGVADKEDLGREMGGGAAAFSTGQTGMTTLREATGALSLEEKKEVEEAREDMRWRDAGSPAEKVESSADGGHCPYIVSFYDAFADAKHGCLTLVVEYMNGGSLQDLLVDRGGCGSEDILAHVAYNVLQGLEFLHARKKIHRDIKPSNLLLNSAGFIKLADFGVSRSLDGGEAAEGEEAKQPLADTFIGTLGYMSPERITGQGYSFGADIWGFGLSMLAVAVGAFPLKQPTSCYWGLVHAVCDSPSPEAPPAFSPLFHDFIRQCLTKDPGQRASSHALLQHPFIASRHHLHKDARGHVMEFLEDREVKVAELETVCQVLARHLTQKRRKLAAEADSACRNSESDTGWKRRVKVEKGEGALGEAEEEWRTGEGRGEDNKQESGVDRDEECATEGDMGKDIDEEEDGKEGWQGGKAGIEGQRGEEKGEQTRLPMLRETMVQRLAEELALEEGLVAASLEAAFAAAEEESEEALIARAPSPPPLLPKNSSVLSLTSSTDLSMLKRRESLEGKERTEGRKAEEGEGKPETFTKVTAESAWRQEEATAPELEAGKRDERNVGLQGQLEQCR